MPYKIVKDNQIIASFGRVTVVGGGVLECRAGFGERVELLLPPGQWDLVKWEASDVVE